MAKSFVKQVAVTAANSAQTTVLLSGDRGAISLDRASSLHREEGTRPWPCSSSIWTGSSAAFLPTA